MEQVDETHAALEKPTGEQTICGERTELSRPTAALGLDRRVIAIDAVSLANVLGLAGEVDQLGGSGLHAEGQLVGGDAALNLCVAHPLVMLTVKIGDRGNALALQLARKAGRAGEV